ncbi:caspase recruitment domain-containing protein 16-like isoform X3 [Neovison vison]|uniref:caspase recruitment domain-containing protein 16-like isoform X3 n=1 Tax=Neovison vison TaxID=452646 RepID=UPI001CEFFE86|nr:caspase recruitment domain-containing protein 16-like isoform X3 [Neogale vison]
MADKILKDRRRLFVSSVSPGTLSSLLDELLDKKVLNQEEMERVRCENATTMDKARALIDSIIRKGPQACQILIAFICAEDSFLAEKLELSAMASAT